MLAGALSYRLFVFALPLAFFLVSGLGLLASALGVRAARRRELGRHGRDRHQAGPERRQGRLELVGRAHLAARARLRDESPAPGGRDRPRTRLGRLGRLGQGAAPAQLEIFAAALAGQLVLVAGVGAVSHQTVIGGIIALVVFVLALAGLWLVVSLQLPHADARWTDLIPGSLFYAIGIVGVQIFNVLILGQMIKEKSTTYGALGIAAAILLDLLPDRPRDRRSRRPQRHPLRAQLPLTPQQA